MGRQHDPRRRRRPDRAAAQEVPSRCWTASTA
jgi:hypothetical protein